MKKLRSIFHSILDKKGVDGRLTSTQKALMLQEETLRQNERARKQMADKISMLERQLAASECEKRDEEVSVHTCELYSSV